MPQGRADLSNWHFLRGVCQEQRSLLARIHPQVTQATRATGQKLDAYRFSFARENHAIAELTRDIAWPGIVSNAPRTGPVGQPGRSAIALVLFCQAPQPSLYAAPELE